MSSMQWSLTASALIHVAILAAAIVVLPSPDRHAADEMESIPVEIIDIEEISQRQAVSKQAEDEPEAKPGPRKIEEAEKVQAAPEAAEEIEQAAREPEPEPPMPALEPLDELIEAAAAEPEPAPEPEPQLAAPVPLPKTKPQPPKRVEKPEPEYEFDPDKIADSLLDKSAEKNTAPPKADDPAARPTQADYNSPSGADDRLSADLIDTLRRRIESCWAMPSGAYKPHELVIRLEFALNPDGSLAAPPEVVNTSPHRQFDMAARLAVNAVRVCEPYDFLPVEKYDQWRELIMNFDPSRIAALN